MHASQKLCAHRSVHTLVPAAGRSQQIMQSPPLAAPPPAAAPDGDATAGSAATVVARADGFAPGCGSASPAAPPGVAADPTSRSR
jgi:hypothetical protein